MRRFQILAQFAPRFEVGKSPTGFSFRSCMHRILILRSVYATEAAIRPSHSYEKTGERMGKSGMRYAY